MFFMLCNYTQLSGMMTMFLPVRKLPFSLLPMKMTSLKLRMSLVIALAMVVLNTLSSRKDILFLNPLGNHPLTYIVLTFFLRIFNAEGCIEAIGGGGDVKVCFCFILSFAVLRALPRSTIALL